MIHNITEIYTALIWLAIALVVLKGVFSAFGDRPISRRPGWRWPRL